MDISAVSDPSARAFLEQFFRDRAINRKFYLELIELLDTPVIDRKRVLVPWSKTPISAVTALWGLDSHEILHTGWNLALMDHLGIPRFPELQAMWG